MPRRSAVTLVEVLVAIFIMAIGLIALLTLFPIGMLRMAQAIRDQRAAESAHNAHALSIMNDIRNDPWVVSDIPTGGVMANLFLNPGPINPGTGKPFLPDADLYGESYPIFVDPIGYGGAPTAVSRDWVGGQPGVLRRRSVSFTAGSPTNILRSFSLWDDLTFNGILAPPAMPGTPQMTGPAVMRDTRFSWGYVFRRPQTRDTSIVDCAIVVFDQRSLSPVPGTLTLNESVYTNVTFNPSNNTVRIPYGANPPPVRPGDWIMDSTFYQAATAPNAGTANANFYRVVSADEQGGNVVVYEVQQPIRGYLANTFPGGYGAGVAGTPPGTAVVISGIAEVIEKGPVRVP